MIAPEELERPGDPEFMTSLARGLAVMRCIAAADRPATIAVVTRQIGLSRAAVRRCIHTLMLLGYVAPEPGGFVVRRQALALGHPHLSLNALAARAQPTLDALRDELGESCSLGVMEDDQLTYVARAEATRVMSVGLRVGSHLPLYCTSMGRVLLADRSSSEQEAYLTRTRLVAQTSQTVTDPRRLLILIRSVSTEGFALVDQELEVGLISIAVPVTNRGKTVASLNVGTTVLRYSAKQMRDVILPRLLQAAHDLSH